MCIVLLWGKSRLYSSFTNFHKFWNYYTHFKGRRCFYWINRSFEITEEKSILHFDIEWFTKEEDPNTTEKLQLIKTAVVALTSNTIIFHEEQLSRPHHENGWKNSFHIYTDLLFEHNAEGCMRDFVKDQVWPKLSQTPE